MGGPGSEKNFGEKREVRKNFWGHALQIVGKRSILEEHPKMRNGKFLVLDYLVRKLRQAQDVIFYVLSERSCMWRRLEGFNL